MCNRDMTNFNLPTEWIPFLNPFYDFSKAQAVVEFLQLERLSKQILPNSEDTFRAFELTLPSSIEVVILGQDPYPTPGNAHGLAFSVQDGVKIPASLKNIFKELESDLSVPISKSGNLTPWAKQGILLLNTVLSVVAGEAGSHRKKGWEQFTDAVIQAISASARPVVFLLWGADAQKKKSLIDSTRHLILESVHPSPLSARNGFFGSKPFSQINNQLVNWGRTAIDWKLSE
jgi:uracil-DNA glycosylase